MSLVGLPERATQDRVVALFRHELGCRYLDSLAHEVNNSKVEEPIVSAYPRRNGYTPAQIGVVLRRLLTGRIRLPLASSGGDNLH